jgi:hypothetical protein
MKGRDRSKMFITSAMNYDIQSFISKFFNQKFLKWDFQFHIYTKYFKEERLVILYEFIS